MKKIAPFVLVLAALWVAWCSGKSAGAANQQAHQADVLAQIVHDSTEHWKAQFLARDSARDDSLRRMNTTVSQQAGAIASLRSRIVPIKDTDSVLNRQVALRDSLIARQDVVIAQQGEALTLAQAMIRDRNEFVARQERELTALRVSRDTWRKVAQPNLLTRAGRAVPWIAAGYLAAKLVK